MLLRVIAYLFRKRNQLQSGELLLGFFFDAVFILLDSLRCGGRRGFVLSFALAAWTDALAMRRVRGQGQTGST